MTCAACGKTLEGATSRRKYCDDRCKRRFHRGSRANAEDRQQDRDEPVEGIQSTEAATMLALAEAGKLGTADGQAALVLARRIDASHRDTGAGLASMVKQLGATMAVLLDDGAPVEDDPVDELERRRQEKVRAAASG